MILSHINVAAEAASGEAEAAAVVLVIGETWGPGGGKAPTLRSPGVDTAPLIISTLHTEDREKWSK